MTCFLHTVSCSKRFSVYYLGLMQQDYKFLKINPGAWGDGSVGRKKKKACLCLSPDLQQSFKTWTQQYGYHLIPRKHTSLDLMSLIGQSVEMEKWAPGQRKDYVRKKRRKTEWDAEREKTYKLIFCVKVLTKEWAWLDKHTHTHRAHCLICQDFLSFSNPHIVHHCHVFSVFVIHFHSLTDPLIISLSWLEILMPL